MEIPIMSTVSGFEAGINSLQNPSLISRIFTLSGIGEIPELHSFWTWGALILALIATFSRVLNRTKLILFRIPNPSSSISDPLLNFTDDDETSSSSDDEDDCNDLFSSSMVGPFVNQTEEDFRVANSGKFDENQGQICKLKPSSSVVKLWDGLGMGLDNCSGFISMWDLNKGEIVRSFTTGGGQIPAICVTSPEVMVSAGVDSLRVWDSRVGSQIPVTVAEWEPRRKKIGGIDSGGVEKVYVRDDVGSAPVVRDLRNVRTPLTESDVQTWFDADAVMVSDSDEGFENAVTLSWPGIGCGSDSVVSRCRNAVRC
ncbi:uncharacterized protein LOC143892121 [Tasmannia lanceolata]|uniref:uncharacterized protein LOC143892121 n=1 Tax=Tasmannia lanceolata TaxID=3420 RepID=UPI004064A2E1